MSYQTDEPIKLTRDCQVVAVPAGHTLMLQPEGLRQVRGRGAYVLVTRSKRALPHDHGVSRQSLSLGVTTQLQRKVGHVALCGGRCRMVLAWKSK